jgi:putative transposase
LGACLEDTRQLYNAALEERREAWRMGRHRVTFYSQDAQLKEIRTATAAMSPMARPPRPG